MEEAIARFEDFTSYIIQAYKYILKIKTYEMNTFGLKAAHVMCLFYIGRHPEGLTPQELGNLCQADKAGISKALSALRRQGMVQPVGEKSQIYRMRYTLTGEGERVYQAICPFIRETVDACSAALTEEERAVLYGSLKQIVHNLEGYYQTLEAKS